MTGQTKNGLVFAAVVAFALAGIGAVGLWGTSPPAPGSPEPDPSPVAPPPPVAAPAVVPVWPAAGAPLFDVVAAPPAAGPPLRVLVDAGHGALGNHGNTSVRCELEQDFTRRTADALAERLLAAGGLDVRRTRPDAALVSYSKRIAQAEGWPADALIGLHSDARGSEAVSPDPVTGCTGNHGSAGFSVLYADDAAPELVEPRRRLAQAIAKRMVEAGFPPYVWNGYEDLYDGDREHPGVFVDRHAPKQRIKMLRVPKVPTVIIETHQALDPDEVLRWDEPRTNEVFAEAVRAALIDFGANR